MAKDLATLARAFARAHPRRNPPEDDLDTRVDLFITERKRNYEKLSTKERSEDAWRDALSALGVPDEDMPIYLEQVAGWGVDD